MPYFFVLRSALGAAMIENIHWGSSIYAAKVQAKGILNHQPVRYECSIRGEKESVITGMVAAWVASQVYTSQCRAGIFHIEELFSPAKLIADLGDFITFEEKFQAL
jgi:saccharopine dehydrogenase (NAD+, L-lysine forming)